MNVIDGKSPRHIAVRPDASRTPGEWIARYVRRALSHDPDPHLDYAVLTHFHGDHMAAFPVVGASIPIRKMLDRGWPDYNYPARVEGPEIAAYRAFLKAKAIPVERFRPGQNDQIVLRRERQKYPEFEVRNVAANGEVWTGVATNTRIQFPPLEQVPPADRPSENMCSLVFRLSYGKFDYYSGGDIPGVPDEGAPSWHDLETPVAQAVGPVEVALMDHTAISTARTLLRSQRCIPSSGCCPCGIRRTPRPGSTDGWNRDASTRVRAISSPQTCTKRTAS